jgi:hypothetical protein
MEEGRWEGQFAYLLWKVLSGTEIQGAEIWVRYEDNLVSTMAPSWLFDISNCKFWWNFVL